MRLEHFKVKVCMKKIFFYFLISISLFSFGSDEWITNLEIGKDIATKNNKYILLEFSGSDWCQPCKMLNEEVFNTDEWKLWSKENIICVLIDRPLNGLDPIDLEYNKKIAELYKVKYFPTIIIIDNKGNEKFRLGYSPGGALEFINQLNKLAKESLFSFN